EQVFEVLALAPYGGPVVGGRASWSRATGQLPQRRSTPMRTLALLVALIALALVSAGGASAHNAGYVILNGECQAVGSDNPGPDVPEQNPNRNTLGPASDLGHLDLIPDTPGDQYGARFAAEQSPAIYPPFSRTQTC